MARDFIKCVAESVKAGIINEDQAEQMRQEWMNLKSLGYGDDKAKDIYFKEKQAEIEYRERAAYKNAQKLRHIDEDVYGWTNARGEKDPAQGWEAKFYRRADIGQFAPHSDPTRAMSMEERRTVLRRMFYQEIAEVEQEFRKGWLTGDLKRTSKVIAAISPSAARVQARALDVLRAMKGEGTKDPVAKRLADILSDAVEKLRVRFNEAGGFIGKLEGWTPQYYDGKRMLDYRAKHGLDKLIDFWIEQIDWDKTRSMYSDRKFSPAEQREILRDAFYKIVTDGISDKEDFSAPRGKGALYKQHADHRFLHYKSADHWMNVAREFGNADTIGAVFGWAETMIRDISAMETFGTNPPANIIYMENKLNAGAKMYRPVAEDIKEAKEKLKALAQQMTRANPNYQTLIDRRADILMELDALRSSRAGATWRMKQAVRPDSPDSPMIQAYLEQKAKLDRDLMDVQKQLMAHEDKGTTTITDLQVEAEFKRLLETMPDPIEVYDKNNPEGYTERRIKRARAYWDDSRGIFSTPVDSQMAEAFSIARNNVAFAMLGGAAISSISDAATQQRALMTLGRSLAKSNAIKMFINTIKWSMPMNRTQAARAYLVTESLINSQFANYKNLSMLSKLRMGTGYTVDRVLAVSGQQALTRGGKGSFGMEFMGHMADHVNMTWAELPDEFRTALQKGSFGPEQWDKLRAVPLQRDPNGATWLTANDVMRADKALGERYLAMMSLFERHAVIESTPEGRAILFGQTQRGTVAGEMLRTAGQLKGFPVTVALMTMGPVVNDVRAGRGARSAQITAAYIISGMMLGVVAMAMKDVAAGRDPRRWLDEDTYLDPNIWAAALLQSGGLGIYGDFLFSKVNRHGAGLGETIAGPMWQRVTNINNLTTGNLIEMVQNGFRVMRGEETKSLKFGKEFSQFLRTNFPAVFWNRLILDRVLFDEAQKLLDPEASIAFDREIKRRRKEFRQEYFWAPGTTVPQRPPDLLRQFATR